MPEITVTLELSCTRCGTDLAAQAESPGGKYKQIKVEPCEKCLDEAKEEGDDEGYSRGHDEALEEAEVDDG